MPGLGRAESEVTVRRLLLRAASCFDMKAYVGIEGNGVSAGNGPAGAGDCDGQRRDTGRQDVGAAAGKGFGRLSRGSYGHWLGDTSAYVRVPSLFLWEMGLTKR